MEEKKMGGAIVHHKVLGSKPDTNSNGFHLLHDLIKHTQPSNPFHFLPDTVEIPLPCPALVKQQSIIL